MVIADAPACNPRERPARLVERAVLDTPGSPEQRELVVVSVNLDADGKPTSATISRSSGNAAVDQEALTLAHQSTYAPPIVDCVTTPGTYKFFAVIDPATLGQPVRLCGDPDQEAVVTRAAAPLAPPSAGKRLFPVAVLVIVTIAPSGNLANARIFKTSGNEAIDEAALDAARRSQFAPKYTNCKPTTGSYILREEFSAPFGQP
jgi:TonB family protein